MFISIQFILLKQIAHLTVVGRFVVRAAPKIETMNHFIPQTSSLLALSLLQLISISVFIIPSRGQGMYSCSSVPSNQNSSINNLLDSLSSYASNETFYNDSSNGIYGLFLCRGDVSNQKCHSCVMDAISRIKVTCSWKTSAVLWFDECMLRYSVDDFIGTMVRVPLMLMWNSVENKTNPGVLETDARAILYDTVTKAREANLMYSANNQNYTDTYYALAQCTRDISKLDCHDCLKYLVDYSEKCCKQRKGWRLLNPNCNLRLEEYLFYYIQDAPPPSLPVRPPSIPVHPPSLPLLPPPDEGGNVTRKIVISVSTVAAVTVLLGLLYCLFCRRNKTREQDRSEELPLRNLHARESDHKHFDATNQESDEDMHFFDFSTLKTATNNFADANKLGEGGFGPVYKGKLFEGEEIAVKRLSEKSNQGHEEFKNEAKVIWKLQHKNLVRLLGCCVEGEEKLLVYEYMANTSLDAFLFDPLKCKQLDWLKRKNIVNGTAKGILYLHEDSRLKIIHRDLKASNILLDEEMNPKISDFGTARIFGGKQIDASTNRIVGTYGYMAPEYAMEGVFSMKSDVYSFGVLILEMISGRKNISFLNMDKTQNLLSYVWELWSEDRAEEMIDKNLVEDFPLSEAIRWIHIGLLCVQEDPNTRPTMSIVVLMLVSQSIQLPQPSKPPFLPGQRTPPVYQYSTTETGSELPTTDQSSTTASI